MEVLKYLRKKYNVTQQELADYLQIKRNAISRYETGVRDPDYQTLVRIAKYFHVSVDYLLGNDTLSKETSSNDEIFNYFKAQIPGTRMKRIRHYYGLSQIDLINLFSLTKIQLDGYENHSYELDQNVIGKIAEYFKVPVEYFSESMDSLYQELDNKFCSDNPQRHCISQFYGIKIFMYEHLDRVQPKIRAEYLIVKNRTGTGYAAYYDINEIKIVGGDLPQRAQNLVVEWMKQNQTKLLEMWETQNFKEVNPLD